jgi:F0F1-type ATP synthase epsilon subunit
MKFIFYFCAFFLLPPAFADVDPSRVEIMLDQMVKEKTISPEEAVKAKIKMKTMSKDQWSNLNRQAETQASRMPASVPEASTDIDGAQLNQIQNDMKNMMPQ